ncbi:MAG: hypothetical protein ACOC1V_05295 [Candidatus Saliniplasma sp.]
MMTNGSSRFYRGFVFLILVLMVGNIVFSFNTRGQGAPGQPEIVVEDIRLSDEEPMEGDNITISALIRNNESEPIDDLTVIYYFDSFEIGNISGVQLNANESEWHNLSWEAQAGDYKISVALKYRGMMIQGDKLSKEVSVEPEPIGDIYTLSISFVVILSAIFATMVVHSIKKSIRS